MISQYCCRLRILRLMRRLKLPLMRMENFIHSRKVEKGKDMVTVIPVTEDSASRSSGIAPHPLCDKLCYIAGDYTQYTGDNKEEYYKQYMQLLGDWAESEETHFMVQAVYKYLEKKTLIHDLVEDHTLELNEKGILTDQIKLQNQGQTGASVRFMFTEIIRL